MRPRAAASGERQRPTRVVGVHVHLQRRSVADDEQRVAERVELGLDRVGVEVVALDHEDGAVAVARELVVDQVVGQGDGVAQRRLRHRGPCEHTRDAADDLDQARGARVDDACFGERRKQLGRESHTVVAAGDDSDEIGAALCRLGELAQRGQHRALDRLANGAVGGVAGAAQRGGEVV